MRNMCSAIGNMWNLSDSHSSAVNSFVHIKNLAENYKKVVE